MDSPKSVRSGASWVESVVTDASLASRHRRTQRLAAAAESVGGTAPGGTAAARTLGIALALSVSLASAQLLGALVANSIALMADSASMVLDICTYALNLYAECAAPAAAADAERTRLIASGASLWSLCAVSMYFAFESFTTVAAHWGEAAALPDVLHREAPVNAAVVMGFAVAGLAVDLSSLAAFAYYGCGGGQQDLNLVSALMHVAADTLRSLATLLEAVLIGAFHANGPLVDAYITLVVLGTIFVGLVAPLRAWVAEARAWRLRTGENEERSPLLHVHAL